LLDDENREMRTEPTDVMRRMEASCMGVLLERIAERKRETDMQGTLQTFQRNLAPVDWRDPQSQLASQPKIASFFGREEETDQNTEQRCIGMQHLDRRPRKEVRFVR